METRQDTQRQLVVIATVALLAVTAAGWMMAQERPAVRTKQQEPKSAAAPASARPEDEKAIRAAAQAFAKAFQTGDQKAVAALLTEGAEYIDEDGDPVRGREALVKAYGEFFAKRKDLKAESKTDAIRFLGTDTAIEDGTFTVTAPDSPSDSSRYSALYVRQGGKWLIAMLKEWSDDETTKPSLDSLAFLIGTWESQGGDVTAKTTYEWTANKSFIRGQYTITSKKDGVPSSSGTQVIGIDPAVGYIRAWLFDSDGGIGESTWDWDNDHWMIESVGTLSDGSHTTAVNFLTRSGDEAFTWRSVQRTLGGKPQPDIPAVTVKRIAKTAEAPRDSVR